MINYLSGTYNFTGIEMPMEAIMTDDITPNDIKEKVRTWLMQDGWSLRQETPQGAIWAFVATDDRGRKVVVGQNINRNDEVILQGQVNIDEDTTARISSLQETERNEFLWNLRFELLRTNLEFRGIELPLKQIGVTERIFVDGLTKDRFLQRTSEVRKGVLIILWMLARQFSQPLPPKQMGFQR